MVEFFIQRPVLAWVLAGCMMLSGLAAVRYLPLAHYPDIAPPSVLVLASYPGASAQVMENSVTQVLEQELKGLDGLLYFSANSSSDGTSEIILTFQQGIDPDLAQVQVQNRLSLATRRLPSAVQQNGVQVTKLQNSFLLIAAFYDQTRQRSDTDIADWIANQIQDPLSRVPGVGTLQAFGSAYAMRIWLDPHRLNSYQLMPSDVVTAIEQQNSEVSLGELGARPALPEQQLNVSVSALSRLQTPEQFRAIVLKTTSNGALVRLGDVAQVELGSEQYRTTSRLNGYPASGVAVMLAPAANALQTAAAVKARLAQLEPSFPPGIKLAYPEDISHFVELSVYEVLQTLLEAIALVVLVMYVFLRNWRATLIPALTVPVVLLGTLAVLAVAGYSLNTLTLFALVLAIGLLVDDAIVVVENVERIMHSQGVDARTATRQAMREITSAVLGMTLVLAAVFLPMAWFSGSVGMIYRQFSLTIVAAMSLSALVALTLTPALCASLLRPRAQCSEWQWPRYRNSLHWLLQRPRRLVLLYGLLVAGTGLLYQRLPSAFLPEEDQGLVMVQFSLPSGATYPRTAKVAEAVERYFLEQERAVVESVYTIAGNSFSGAGQNAGMAFVQLKDWSLRQGEANRAAAIAARATEALSGLRDAQVFSMVLPPISGLGQSSDLELWLQDSRGQGIAALEAAGAQLMQQAAQYPELAMVRVNNTESTPQLRIAIDQPKASALGLSVPDVNDTLSIAWGGRYVNDFIHQGRVKRVYVQAQAPYRAQPDDLQHWFVRGQSGAMTPFSAFAHAQWEHAPAQLRRYNGLAALQVFAISAPGVSSGSAMQALEQLAQQLPGVSYEWSGLSYQDKLSSGQAPLLYALSLLFIFLCLAALYESWSIPLAVLLVIPLGVIGALAAVLGRGLLNDIYFQVGLLTTMGLSAKNAILLVEFAESAVRAGVSPLTAVLEGARLRLRPIIMTSLAFAAGVVPLVLAHGPGSASQQAIGTGVLGGVTSATLLAVLFVPLFYWLIRRWVPWSAHPSC